MKGGAAAICRRSISGPNAGMLAVAKNCLREHGGDCRSEKSLAAAWVL